MGVTSNLYCVGWVTINFKLLGYPNLIKLPWPARSRCLTSGSNLHVKLGYWPESIHQNDQNSTKSTKTTPQSSTFGMLLIGTIE
jgi:hypothetical protein